MIDASTATRQPLEGWSGLDASQRSIADAKLDMSEAYTKGCPDNPINLIDPVRLGNVEFFYYRYRQDTEGLTPNVATILDRGA